MSNLLTTETGRLILRNAAIEQVKERIKRWFQRNTVIALDEWQGDGEFELSTVLGSLNVAHDPEIYDLNDLLNWLMAGDTTVEDRTFYVDPTAGSDVTGLGTVERPFASLEFLGYSLPDRIEHEIRINLSAGDYTYFPDILLKNKIVKNGGRIIIDASGETYPLIAGTYTIAAVTNVGAVGPDGAALATDIQAVGAPGWAINGHSGNFIHFLDGACAGQVFGIFSNIADTVRIGVDWYGAAPGDTFNLVRCPARFLLTERQIIEGCTTLQDRTWPALSLGQEDSPFSPYLCICACEFSFSDDICCSTFMEDIHLFLSFVKFTNTWVTNNSSWALTGNNILVNSCPIVNTTFQNAALTDWYMANFYSSTQNNTIDVSTLGTRFTKSTLGNIITNHAMSLEDVAFYSALTLRIDSSGFCEFAYAYFEQFPASQTAIKHYNNKLHILSAYFNNVAEALLMYNCDAELDWAQGAGLTANAAIYLFEGFCRVYVNTSASVTIIGTVNVYIFSFTGVGAAAWPGIGASVNDAHGCWIKTIS